MISTLNNKNSQMCTLTILIVPQQGIYSFYLHFNFYTFNVVTPILH